MGNWLKQHYNELFKKYSLEELKQDLNTNNFTKILEHYIKETQYKATTKNLSPMQWLNNDMNIEKARIVIAKNQKERQETNRTQFFKPEDSEVRNMQKYVEMWLSTTSDGHKVSNFNPVQAYEIYKEFALPGNVVLDFSMGYASRLLASKKLNLFYVGIDVNKELCDKVFQMCEELEIKDNHIINKSSEVFIPEYENKVDFIFTSPPYFNLEIYSDEPEQCMNKYKDYDDWLNNYARKTMENCYKYLKNYCYCAINIKNLTSKGKQPLYDDWIKISKEVGFTYVRTQEVHHKKRNQVNEATNVAWKEPLIILRKVK